MTKLIESRAINYNYIKKLAVFLKKEDLEELFTALVLMEKYSLIDDLRHLTREEIVKAHNKYGKYLKAKDTIINRRWLQ